MSLSYYLSKAVDATWIWIIMFVIIINIMFFIQYNNLIIDIIIKFLFFLSMGIIIAKGLLYYGPLIIEK
ncbi:MAG: hypothetical protein ACOCP8_01020 [archaeon]